MIIRNKDVLLRAVGGLVLQNVDVGGGTDISAGPWHVRLGYANTADQEQLRNKGEDVMYDDKVSDCYACLANKNARQPRNKETGTRAPKLF